VILKCRSLHRCFLGEKVDTLRTVRLLAAFLLAIMGITFLVLAGFFGSMLESMETPPALFAIVGVAYVAIALGLFIGKRLFIYLGAIVPLAWACVGILHYTMKQQNPIVFPFVAMEIIVILCCCYIILRKRSS
jgi:hypothetical protein